MAKQLKISILPNGEIQMETMGIKGKKCLDYVKVMQEIAGLKIEKQDLTDEFYEQDEQSIVQNNVQDVTLLDND